VLPHGQEQEHDEERTGRDGYDSDRPPAGITPHRERRCQRRKYTGRNDQQERDPVDPAVPCVGIPASQHRSIDPESGQYQRHSEQN